MTEKEQRVWAYILANRDATVPEISKTCGVSAHYARSIMSRISSENWREPASALDTQVGGSHYRDMAVQPWQALEAWLTAEEYRGYHKGVAIAYLARERQKGGVEDIKKAIHHLQRYVEMHPKDTE